MLYSDIFTYISFVLHSPLFHITFIFFGNNIPFPPIDILPSSRNIIMDLTHQSTVLPQLILIPLNLLHNVVKIVSQLSAQHPHLHSQMHLWLLIFCKTNNIVMCLSNCISLATSSLKTRVREAMKGTFLVLGYESTFLLVNVYPSLLYIWPMSLLDNVDLKSCH